MCQNEFGVFSVLVQLYWVSPHWWQRITKEPTMKCAYSLLTDCLQDTLVPWSDPGFLRHRYQLWKAPWTEQLYTEYKSLNCHSPENSGRFLRFSKVHNLICLFCLCSFSGVLFINVTILSVVDIAISFSEVRIIDSPKLLWQKFFFLIVEYKFVQFSPLPTSF